MDIILLENVRNLGKFGTKVQVAKGYGRNYLIPQGKAVPATKNNVAKFEASRAELEKIANDKLQKAELRATELSTLQLVIPMRAAEEGKLYGSVGTLELTNAFKDKGITVLRGEIRLPQGAYRETGEYQVDLQLHAEVVATVSVSIVPEKAP